MSNEQQNGAQQIRARPETRQGTFDAKAMKAWLGSMGLTTKELLAVQVQVNLVGDQAGTQVVTALYPARIIGAMPRMVPRIAD